MSEGQHAILLSTGSAPNSSEQLEARALGWRLASASFSFKV